MRELRLCRAWRATLKEWLAVLAAVRGLRGIWGAAEVRRAVALQLSDTDPAIQLAALDGLKVCP